jgi:DNA-3-methyladenine glycosylase II
MKPVVSDNVAQQAAEFLGHHDAVLAPIIARVGPPTFRPHTDYYWELVDSIISQQLSVKAAASIERRFQDLFGSEVPPPEQILQKSVEELRTVGLSRPKANYIRDLAQHIVDGKISFDAFVETSNEDIIHELTSVKGIGEWTAHMFLMFCLGRTDILPVGDLGIRNGIRDLYGFDHAPSPKEIADIAETNHWHPYESIASWYVWKHLDNSPNL